MNLSIDDIKIGDRFRHDIGDISELAASIDDHGLLHPIVVTGGNVLIAGRRRLEACRALGWTEISVTVINPLDIRRVEADENQVRLDFTASEAVEVTRYFEEAEKEAARERQAIAGKERGRGEIASGKLPEAIGDTRDALAARVGMSGRTLEKATAVVDAAEKDPEQFGPVKEEMDRTGKVDPAFKKVSKPKRKKDVLDVNELYMSAAQDAYLALDKKWQKKFRAWLRTAEGKGMNS